MLLWLCGLWGGALVPPFPVSSTYHSVSHIGPGWVELKCLIVGRLVKLVNQDRRKRNIFRNKENWNPITEPSVWDELWPVRELYGYSDNVTTCPIWMEKLTLTGYTMWIDSIWCFGGVAIILPSNSLWFLKFSPTLLMGSFSDLPSLEEMPLLQVP